MAFSQGAIAKKNGQVTVGTSAIPLTQAAAVSSSNTTFTHTTVVDGTVWTLSGVLVGDIAETSDGYLGQVTAVNDATDTVTVKGWTKEGSTPTATSTVVPTAGSTVRIHHILRAGMILIKAGQSNSGTVYVGTNSTAVNTDYPLVAGEPLIINPAMGEQWVDVMSLYILGSDSGQLVNWMIGGGVPNNQTLGGAVAGSYLRSDISTNYTSGTLTLADGTTILVKGTLQLADTNDSHAMSVVWNENDTANRVLNLLVGGADRSLTFGRNLATATTPLIATGTAIPATTPAQVGDIFIDTTNSKVYVADGTTNSNNWVLAN